MAATTQNRISPAWMMLLAFGVTTSGWSQDELGQRASWEAPTVESIRADLDGWLGEVGADEITRLKVDTIWQMPSEVAEPFSLLDQFALTIATVDPSARAMVDLCTGVRTSSSVPDFAAISDGDLPPFVQRNLRLFYGRWLAQHDLYDQALHQIGDLKAEDVIDPASLLFYQGVANHRLLNKDECLAALDQLLENEDQIPRRFTTLAHLMVADIRPLAPDSLDEIARLMDDIRRRQQQSQSGKIVRDEEEDVVAKLDKLIEEIEKQQQQQQNQSSGSPQGGRQSNQPLQDSLPAGGRGEGNVDPKQIGRGSNWGDLPAKDRQAALQNLSKDLPAHYREIIEEYFRKLARDDPQ